MGAKRKALRRGNGVGRCRQCLSLRASARIDPEPQADRVHRNEQLRSASCQSGGGIDLASCSVRKMICSAETLSNAKREKLSRMWGAEVFDVFGMSEAGLMG